MHIISFKKIREYFIKEANAKVALEDWFKQAKKAEWNNYADMKNTFNSVDSVGNDRYIFNIKGNHYRIVAIVLFRIKRVYVRWVGSHKEYDKIKILINCKDMEIITHQEYAKANIRLEELLKVVGNKTPDDSPLIIELIEISDLIEQYEEIHFPIGLPSLTEVIELRMFEMKLKRKDVATLLNTSAPRISDYLNGKRDITLGIARSLHQRLNIDSDIILQ